MQSNRKTRLVSGFIIATFVSLYLIVSVISTIHVIEFFELSNPRWLAISLAIAFEIGAAASLASLIALEKMNKFLVWILFFILTGMQAMGNTYYAYSHLHDFQSWVELFGLNEEELIYQKRVLSVISGAILPLVALGFIKSLVDYIKPSDNKEEEVVVKKDEENINHSLESQSGINDEQEIPKNSEISEDEIVVQQDVEIAQESNIQESKSVEEIKQDDHQDSILYPPSEDSSLAESDPISEAANKETMVVSAGGEKRIDAGNSSINNDDLLPINMGRAGYANPSVDIHPTKLT